jgi:hypothetical protein
MTSPVQAMLAEQRRMQDRMMKKFGPLATAGPANMYVTAGSSVAKGIVVNEPFGFARSLYAGVATADVMRMQDTLAAQHRMREKLMGYDAVAAQAAARAATAYGTLGPVAKAGWTPDTSGVAKAWQSQTGIGSAVQDKVHELERMHDRRRGMPRIGRHGRRSPDWMLVYPLTLRWRRPPRSAVCPRRSGSLRRSSWKCCAGTFPRLGWRCRVRTSVPG